MIAAALEDATWSEDAVVAIIGLAHDLPQFTSDDLRKEMRAAPSQFHYGAAFLAAKTAGYIEATGYQTSANKTRRRGSLRTWRRKINEGVAA